MFNKDLYPTVETLNIQRQRRAVVSLHFVDVNTNAAKKR
jgi:hypothetical protein